MTTDDTSPFDAEPEPAAPAGETDAQAADREDWRGPQDDPWQPEEEAPPPVIGD